MQPVQELAQTPAQFWRQRRQEAEDAGAAQPTDAQLQFQAQVREEAEAAPIAAQEKADAEAVLAESARGEIVAQVQVQINASEATNKLIEQLQLEQQQQQ